MAPIVTDLFFGGLNAVRLPRPHPVSLAAASKKKRPREQVETLASRRRA